MSTAFCSTELFGGAIIAELPCSFADVSEIREVPDNQEVYVARNGLTSIIIEIVEWTGPPEHPCSTDEEALLYHYQDIIAPGHVREEQNISAPQEETKLWSSNKAYVDHLPNAPSYTLLATQHPPSIVPGKPDFTAILMTLIRLPAQATDILVTINVPHAPGEYQTTSVDLAAGKPGPHIDAALQARSKLLSTFAVQDWSLFGEEQESTIRG